MRIVVLDTGLVYKIPKLYAQRYLQLVGRANFGLRAALHDLRTEEGSGGSFVRSVESLVELNRRSDKKLSLLKGLIAARPEGFRMMAVSKCNHDIYAGGDVCGPHDIVHLAVAQVGGVGPVEREGEQQQQRAVAAQRRVGQRLQRRAVERRVLSGEAKILYLAPERLRSLETVLLLRRAGDGAGHRRDRRRWRRSRDRRWRSRHWTGQWQRASRLDWRWV